MLISELARKVNVSVETVRFYEKQGLLEQPKRLANGYRDYSETTVHQLAFILRVKQAGFSLKECEILLSIWYERADYTCEDVKTLANAKLLEIQEQITHLQSLHQTLNNISKACCGGPESAEFCQIINAFEEGEV